MVNKKQLGWIGAFSLMGGLALTALNPALGLLGFIGGSAATAASATLLIKAADLACYVGSTVLLPVFKAITWPLTKMAGPLCFAGGLGLTAGFGMVAFSLLSGAGLVALGAKVAACGLGVAMLGAFGNYIKDALKTPPPKPQGTLSEQLDKHNREKAAAAENTSPQQGRPDFNNASASGADTRLTVDNNARGGNSQSLQVNRR